MSSDELVIKIITDVGVAKPIAEEIVRRLGDEGLLMQPSFGDKTVSRIVGTFKEAFGTTKTSRYDRYAASRLATRYSADQVCQIIVLMAGAAAEPYAPVINNVSELENKWVSVLAHIKKQYNNSELNPDE